MAWQQSDLDALEAAIASGVMLTRYADGSEVRYQSLDHMIAARAVMQSEITVAAQLANGVRRTKFAAFRSGF